MKGGGLRGSLLLCGALLAVVFAVVLGRTYAGRWAAERPDGADEQGSVRLGGQADSETSSAPAVDQRLPTEDDVRRPVESADDGALRVHVVGHDGEPLAGAVVRGLVERGRDVPRVVHAAVEPQVILSVTTGAGGVATIDAERRERLQASDAWLQAEAPGSLAARLAPDGWRQQDEVTLELDAASPVHVTVLGPDGRPRAGARIVQFAVDASSGPGMTEGQSAADGVARLAALDGEVRLVASDDGLRSEPWRGASPEEVELRLVDTVALSGRVELPEAAALDEPRFVVVVSARAGAVDRRLTVVEVEGLEFGPLELPAVASGRYRVELSGSGTAPTVEEVEVTSGQRSAFVTLRPPVGAELRGRVSTRTGEEIAGATAEVRWREEDGDQARIQLEADPTGRFRSLAVPAGPVQVTFRAPGFVATQVHYVTVPNEEDALWVGLEPAAPLAGRVLLPDGTPARDFTLLVWPVGRPSGLVRAEVYGAREGRFRVEEVPTGELFVLAAGPESPASEAARVRTGTAEAEDCELRLLAAHPAYLEVVGASGSTPLEGATVTVFTSGPDGALWPWGAPARVGADGLADDLVVAPGRAFLRVEATEHRTTLHQTVADGAVPYDLGRVELAQAAEVRVHVVASAEDDRPPAGSSDWEVGLLQGGVDRPFVRLGADGEVVFDEVGAGEATIGVYRPDDGMQTWLFRELAGDGTDEVVVRWGGAKSLTVELLEADGEPYLGRARIVASVYSADEQKQWDARVEHGSSRRFTGIEVDRVSLSVSDEYDELLATQVVGLPQVDNVARVVLGGREQWIVVRGADGELSDGAWVGLRSRSEPSAIQLAACDQAGRAEFVGLIGEAHLARVWPTSGGMYDGLEVDFAGEDELELRLGPTGPLEVLCADGDVSLGGVRVTPVDVFDQAQPSVTTDAEGRAVIADVGPGRLRLRLDGEGVWRTEQRVEVRAGAEPVRLQAMRTGRLRLRALDEAGTPLGLAELQLEHEGTGETVAAWIEAGLVAGDLPLRTNADGSLELTGLPRGDYAWTCETAAVAGNGQLAVAPGTTTDVGLTLLAR